ncbi:hypothetical protein PpBr36_08925 [Pyricularia pennisetigena]|uniref:hypothetical protein n=1 Tax=Pyricularia pennisetigena TaxID=1578925 RepID=UPI00115054E3|nr:hypothetical protein PpBr36_08925 [Pyricularia pennisetigena]TLS24652.1 hypothetical protein PpBr36_08925 [Pyricularia pennisetigena]
MITSRKHCSDCNVTVVDVAESDDGKGDSKPVVNNSQQPPQPLVGPSEEEVKGRRRKLKQKAKASSSNAKPKNGSAKPPASEKATASEPPKPASVVAKEFPVPLRCSYENLMLEMLARQQPPTAWPRLKKLSDLIDAERRAAEPSFSPVWQLTLFWGKPATAGSTMVFRTLDPFLSTHAVYSGPWFGLKACILLRDDEHGGGGLPFSISKETYDRIEVESTAKLIEKMDVAVERLADARVLVAWRALFGIGEAIALEEDAEAKHKLFKVMGFQSMVLKELVAGDEACRRALEDFQDATRLSGDVEAVAFNVLDKDQLAETVFKNLMLPTKAKGDSGLESTQPLVPNGNSSEHKSSQANLDELFDFIRAACIKVMVKRRKMISHVAGLHEVADQQAIEGERITKILKEAQAAHEHEKMEPDRLLALHVLWRSHLASMQDTMDLLQTATDTLTLAEMAFAKLPGDAKMWNDRCVEKLAATGKELGELETKMAKLQVVIDEHQAKDHAAEAAAKIEAIMAESRRELGEIEKRRKLRQDPVYSVCKEALTAVQHENPDASPRDWPAEFAEADGGVGWEDVSSRRAPAATNSGSSLDSKEEVE